MRASCVADEREWGIYRPPTIQPIAATAIIPIPIVLAPKPSQARRRLLSKGVSANLVVSLRRRPPFADQ
jgi:hypothetical protein